ncbi:hypothetical protein ACOMHN_038183 [Nucella lapillus]
MAEEAGGAGLEKSRMNGEGAGDSSAATPVVVSSLVLQHCDSSHRATSHPDPPGSPSVSHCDPSHLSTPHGDPSMACCDSSNLTAPQCEDGSSAAARCDLSHLSTPCSDPGHLTAEGGAGSRWSGSEGDNRGSGKKLQKADSGIEVEKSPSVSVREALSDADGGDSVSECGVDSTGLSHSESFRSDDSQGQAEEDMAVDSSILDSNAPPSCVCPTESAATNSKEENMDVTSTTEGGSSNTRSRDIPQVDDEDEDDVSTDADTTLGEHQFLTGSSKDGDDEVSEETDRVAGEKSEDEEEVNRNPWPKHKWRVVPDLRAREIGVTGCTPPSLFREKVQGSLYMVQRLKLQHRMEHHEGCVNSLHFNRIGTLLASGADDLQIVLWNWARNSKALVYDSGHRSNVFQAKFMPYSGDCHVVSCARDGQVRLSELSLTGVCKNTKKLAQHRGAAHKLALEYDSPHVFLSCGEDALTYQIDLREERPNKLIVTKENDNKVPLYSIHSNPVNPYQFLTSGRDPYVRMYDKRKINESVNSGIVKKYCPKHLDNSSLKTNVTCACYSFNGSEIIGSYNDEDIYLFDNTGSDSTDAVRRYSGHRNNATVKGVSFYGPRMKGVSFYGPRSDFVVTGSDCGHVYLWDKDTEHIVHFLEADRSGVVNVLEPHPFAPVLATSGLDHDVKIFAPISHDPPRMEGLSTQKRKNWRDRRANNDCSHEPDMIDGQMLWFIMNHFRRSARRRLRQGGEDVSSSSNSSDSDEEDDEDHDGAAERMQCQTS